MLLNAFWYNVVIILGGGILEAPLSYVSVQTVKKKGHSY